jgi:hypothetical protein
MNFAKPFICCVCVAASGQALAQEITLDEHLATIAETEVTFSGDIMYDHRAEKFSVKMTDGSWISAIIDAGRDARSKIEQNCTSANFFTSDAKICSISGAGHVDARGSELWLSIVRIEELSW